MKKTLSKLTAKELVTRRWALEKAETKDFYYDEEAIKDITK